MERPREESQTESKVSYTISTGVALGCGCVVLPFYLAGKVFSGLGDAFYYLRNREFLEWDARRRRFEKDTREDLGKLLLAAGEAGKVIETENVFRPAFTTKVYTFDFLTNSPIESYTFRDDSETGAYDYSYHIFHQRSSTLQLKDGTLYHNLLISPSARFFGAASEHSDLNVGPPWITKKEGKLPLYERCGPLDELERLRDLLHQSLPSD